eukprot:scaffold10581_cov117-Isochrysis_galbana.AAC.9
MKPRPRTEMRTTKSRRASSHSRRVITHNVPAVAKQRSAQRQKRSDAPRGGGKLSRGARAGGRSLFGFHSLQLCFLPRLLL